MDLKNLGIIGCGNMAQAMIGGICKAKIFNSENIIVSDLNESNLNKVKDIHNIQISKDNKEVASKSDYIILAIKPKFYEAVIKEIKDVVKKDVIIITIAAGIKIKSTKKMFDKDIKVVRTMPNTPALVGEGMTSICESKDISKDELQSVVNIFESFGKTEIIDESLIDAATSVHGSSPAYAYMFIEALADGGVLEGLPRDKAYKMAAQALLGSAKMILETNEHPGKLKDNVCSPGGTTIEAVKVLEDHKFRAGIIEAVRQCTKKARK
ncbi:MAG: pyrroline-5-carboxylate reductase [Peptostreptococcaceae bacterium]|nr:pyrroline-5-carboxylate reductase [Peptostreptococcaceae bacterium]